MEYIPELMEAQNDLLKDYPVDYMILGEHFLEREPFSPYTGFETTDEAFLKKYVDLVIEGMETGKYSYVAHPDLLHFTGSDTVYKKHFTRLCTYLNEHDIPVEINLLGLRGKRHYPSEKFLRIAQKVGNSAIVGCDAHFPEALSSKKEQNSCIELAEKYGLPVREFLNGMEL